LSYGAALEPLNRNNARLKGSVRDYRVKTSSCKAKGRKLQQHVRDRLLDHHTDLSPDDVVSCPMGSQGADIWLSQAAKATIPFDIECKARAKIALIYDALEQAKRDPDRIALAVVKADRRKPLVVIDLDDFLNLLSH
jgi:hypothetical protein